ncbi:MAG: hypothetical protein P8H62_02045 [Henriciella sp.]|nr:hypothetical protein [Henriciella sp.]
MTKTVFQFISCLILCITFSAMTTAQEAAPTETAEIICEQPNPKQTILCTKIDELDEVSDELLSLVNKLVAYKKALNYDIELQNKDRKGHALAIEAYWESQARKQKLSASVYERQQHIGWRLEAMTWLVVLASLIFIAAQLVTAIKMSREDVVSEIEISATHFKLRSQVIVIIVLIISLIFVSLFYRYVYTLDLPPNENTKPISLVSDQEKEPAPSR